MTLTHVTKMMKTKMMFGSKMIMKMLTHVHKVVITCWCWHIYEGVEV
jgi:hypothetical protein